MQHPKPSVAWCSSDRACRGRPSRGRAAACLPPARAALAPENGAARPRPRRPRIARSASSRPTVGAGSHGGSPEASDVPSSAQQKRCPRCPTVSTYWGARGASRRARRIAQMQALTAAWSTWTPAQTSASSSSFETNFPGSLREVGENRQRLGLQLDGLGSAQELARQGVQPKRPERDLRAASHAGPPRPRAELTAEDELLTERR